jgi:hypothetical protein
MIPAFSHPLSYSYCLKHTYFQVNTKIGSHTKPADILNVHKSSEPLHRCYFGTGAYTTMMLMQ